MEQFNLDTWLENKSRKVVTRRGNPVRIICTDRKHGKDDLPIVFLEENNGGEFLLTCRNDGRCDNYDTQYDLFFADNEPYNPYKAAIESIAEMVVKYEPYCKFDIDSKVCDFFDNVKVKCKDAIEYDKMFPQEEFIPKKQYEEDLEQAYKNADKVQFNRGMDEVLTNPQKYFHIGDTIRPKNSTAEYTIVSIFNGRYFGDGWSLGIQEAADNYELVEDCDETKMTPQEREFYTAHKKRMERFTKSLANNCGTNIIERLKELQKDMAEYAKYLETETYHPYSQTEGFSKRLDNIIKSIEG